MPEAGHCRMLHNLTKWNTRAAQSITESSSVPSSPTRRVTPQLDLRELPRDPLCVFMELPKSSTVTVLFMINFFLQQSRVEV